MSAAVFTHIEPIDGTAARPFWSVMIPTYEPEPAFLREAIGAVLAQDPGPAAMEVVLVDDCSRRVDPRDAIPAAARDRVQWFRQERHAGIGGNWNSCIERARGEWIHILHQDDLVLPGFYQRLRAGVGSSPGVGAAFCRDFVIDRDGRRIGEQRIVRTTAGVVEDWIEHIFVSLHLRASALVVKRATYETLGGYRLDLPYALDWDMWKRIGANVALWYEPEALACHRRHTGSATSDFIRSGANIAEIGRSIELSAALLPASIAAATVRRAKENYSRYGTRMAWRALREAGPRAALAQLRAARRLGSTTIVAGEIVRALQRALRARR